jgi:rhamnosyltransferase
MNRSGPPQSLVSVLIRVRNEEQALRRLLACLRIQKLDRPFEIVVIDNESDDDSAGVARTMGARVFNFPQSLFSYGRAINFGITHCNGELIVLLSAHAWPQGEDWLGSMVNCVEERGVAAAFCRQLAHGKVCRQEKRLFNGFAEHNYKLDTEALVQRCNSGEDVFNICCFSNSAAVVRREVALHFPFRDLPFAEDRAFVLDCVTAGHSIAYLGTASVAYMPTATFRNFYRRACAGEVSKHLIREIGSKLLGTDLRRSDLGENVVRLLCKPLEIIGWSVEAVLRNRSQLWRAARYATISCALSLGCIVGELTWRRYRKTACCGSSVLSLAEKGIATVA